MCQKPSGYHNRASMSAAEVHGQYGSERRETELVQGRNGVHPDFSDLYGMLPFFC